MILDADIDAFLHALDEITTTIWAWQMMNEHMDDICDAMKRHLCTVFYDQ